MRDTAQRRPVNASDVLVDRKCLHVAIDKETHKKLRVITFERGVSMQELIDGFSRAVVAGNGSANKIVDMVVRDKIARELSKHMPAAKVERRAAKVAPLKPSDGDALYELIEQMNSEHEDDK